MRRLARFQHIDPVVRHKRPVVMLSGTIDSGKRLLMQQTLHSMLLATRFNVCITI